MNKLALITGATSGIGAACAQIFASNKYDLILTGRRSEKLEEIKNNIEKKHSISVTLLCFDVRNREETIASLNSLPDNKKNIDILINNAGLAVGVSPIDEGSFDDWDRMIDTNVKGLLNVSKTVIPWLKKQRSGHIVNIGSIAGKEVYPNGNVYCASKHAVDALSQAMRIDLVKHGIKVTNVAPGMVETEFSLVRLYGDANKADQVYVGFDPLTAEDIAETIWFCASRPGHVNIADILILPTSQANAVTVVRN
jgi:NADP-dependent 3-hydroxy acid dehydrogenase YdfG